MAISTVNTNTGTAAVAAASMTLAMPAGIQVDDVVLVAASTGGGNANRTMSDTSGTWTKLCDLYGDGSSIDSNLGVWAKRMGATPDTDITVQINTGTGQWSAIAIAYRGVSIANMLDVAVVTAQGTGSANPDPVPGAITTVTDASEVVLFGASGEVTGAMTYPSGFTTNQIDVVGTSNNRTSTASKNQAVAGLVTPGTFDIGTAVTTRGWTAATVALRPYIVGEGGATQRQKIVGINRLIMR